MSSTVSAPEINREIIQWMGRLENQIASLRSGLTGVSGHPRITALRRLQKAGRDFLTKLVTIFSAQDENGREALLLSYISALRTLKLFFDDVYIESLEEAEHPKDKADLRSPNTAEMIEVEYRETIEDWIAGSLLIDPITSRNTRIYIPKIANGINFPLRPITPLLAEPITAAKKALEVDLQRFRSSSKQVVELSPKTDHLFGTVFLLAQLELKLRWENDQTRQSDVDRWYQAARRPVKLMADEILGIFDESLRSAIFTGTQEQIDQLLTAHHLHINSMATHYSLRRQETRVLLSFFQKETKTGNFAYQEIAVGVNRINEMLFAYAGRPDPDRLFDGEVLSISSLRARETEFTGKSATVFGLGNALGNKLTDEVTKATIAIDAPSNLRAIIALGSDRRVIVKGLITGSEATLTIEATSIIPHSEGYRALVGFPLRFAQTDNKGNLEQLPWWRHTTEALQRAAVRERQEAEEGVFSVPETLVRQKELATDLLRHSEIRKAFAPTSHTVKNLDIQDTEVRVKVWSVLFKELAKNGNRSAVRVIGNYLQGYFSAFTRHTYLNLRDSGKPYLDSPWPTDLTDRKLHDCGVYAVQAAYDLVRAVEGTKSVRLEFRFLTFLNHICLIVFFDNAAFLVNNAKVYPPEDIMPQGVPNQDQKIDAAFMWGGRAFASVYNVSYMMFLAVLPQLSVTTGLSDPAFKNAIWKAFLNSQGWGIKRDVADGYFKKIRLFNDNSIILAETLNGLKSGKKTSVEDWSNATTLALDLYKLGEDVSEANNFVFFNKELLKYKPIPRVGFSVIKASTDNADRPPTLPMYELANLISQRKKRGQTLTADQEMLVQKPTGIDHVNELTDRFLKAGTKP
jgi:hypothetical protein